MKLTALHNKNQKGFTLIELLVVIGILAILLAIVLVAINPAHQFAQARDTQRRSDVNTILNAVHQYMAEHKGIPPTGIPTGAANEMVIGSGAGELDLCTDLVTTYIADMPIDPSTGTPTTGARCTGASGSGTYSTGSYKIYQSATDNRITVETTSEVDGTAISVTR